MVNTTFFLCTQHGKYTFFFCIYHGKCKHFIMHLPWLTQNAFTMANAHIIFVFAMVYANAFSMANTKKEVYYFPCWVHRKKVVFTMVHAMLSSEVTGTDRIHVPAELSRRDACSFFMSLNPNIAPCVSRMLCFCAPGLVGGAQPAQKADEPIRSERRSEN